MMEFVITAAAVAVGLVAGTLIITCVMLTDFMTNKLIKWSMNVTMKMMSSAVEFEEDLEKTEA